MSALRTTAIVALILGAAIAETVGQRTGLPPSEQRPVFRAGVAMVAVDVSVRVRNNPVRGLSERDFELLDNGVPQRIESLSIEAMPLDISLLLDLSASMSRVYAWYLPRVQRQRPQLGDQVSEISGLLTSADKLRVLHFGLEVQETGALETYGPNLPIGRAGPNGLGSLPHSGGTSLYDALFLAMVHDPGPDRRHLILTFTDDAYDTTSVLAANQLVDTELRSDATLHLISVTPDGSSPRPVVDRIVESSGGRVHSHGSPSVPDALEAVLEDYRTRYLLRYSPTGVTPNGWHQIQVRVPRHPRADIRARKGYLAGRSGSIP
jgi:VWFA-related protein